MTPHELAEVQQHLFTQQYPFTLDLIQLQQGLPLMQQEGSSGTAAAAAGGTASTSSGPAASAAGPAAASASSTTVAAGSAGASTASAAASGSCGLVAAGAAAEDVRLEVDPAGMSHPAAAAIGVSGSSGNFVADSMLQLQWAGIGGGYKLQNRRLVYVAEAGEAAAGGGDAGAYGSPGSNDSPLAAAAAAGGAGSLMSSAPAAGGGGALGRDGGGGASSALDAQDSSGLDSSVSLNSIGSGSSRMRSLLVNSSSITGGGGGGASGGVLVGQVYQRRLAPKYTELMYVFDGDRNGVVWHVATEYGTRQWVNPVLSKKIEVKASSPASRYTDPKVRVWGGLRV